MARSLAAGVGGILALTVSAAAGATATTQPISGAFGATEHACTQITHVLGGYDCSYGRNWPGAAVDPDGTTPSWGGPVFGGAHYEVGSTGDSVAYIPTTGAWSGSGTTFDPAADDGKYPAPISGTFTIDDNGTPGNPADDLLSAEFSIGALARNITTGQVTRAIQRWTTMDHVMEPTPVSSAVANGAGGFDYVIGSRGFPERLCNRNDAADCFATPNVPAIITGIYDNDFLVTFWDRIDPNSIGVERTGQLGDPAWAAASPKPPAIPPTGNVGATTTATFTGYSCEATVASDCTTNQLCGAPASRRVSTTW